MLLQHIPTYLRRLLSVLLLAACFTATSASAQCPEDAYEDNDSLADAAAVSAGTITGLRSCLGDDDYFSILLSAGEEITVDVTFAHAEGDIQLELRDDSGTLLASSTTADDDEQIVETPGAGIYVIRVFLAADTGSVEGNDYDLGIGVLPSATTCGEDAYEDNDSLADPAAVSAGTITGLRACLGDDDYFSILLSAGEEITVDATFAHAEGDIQLELRDESGTLLASSSTADDDEQIVETPGAGVFVIRVFLAADTGTVEGNDYELAIAVAAIPSIPILPVPALLLTFLALVLCRPPARPDPEGSGSRGLTP